MTFTTAESLALTWSVVPSTVAVTVTTLVNETVTLSIEQLLFFMVPGLIVPKLASQSVHERIGYGYVGEGSTTCVLDPDDEFGRVATAQSLHIRELANGDGCTATVASSLSLT